VDSDQPVFNAGTLEERVAGTAAQRRARALVLGVFALLALIIAAVGVYGVIAYSVTRRTHEIGVRLALGAHPGNVLWMVVREGLRMAFTGLAIGLAGALSLTRVLRSFLYGVTATDLATFVSVCLVLTAAAFLASYIPARRATRVDPIMALRHE
jgi:putative ABC transport system permease protein